MNPYFLTLAFLMLMSILTSSEVTKFAAHSIENQFYASSLESRLEKEELSCFGQLEDLRDKKPIPEKKPEPKPSERKQNSTVIKRSAKLRFNLERPPNNSRLNFYFLLYEECLPKDLPTDFKYYEVAARLIRNIYFKAPFYLPGCEYRILDELIKLKPKMGDFTYPDDLASLSFENEEIQKIFYLMLKGRAGFPSLLDFITFDKFESSNSTQAKKINLMFGSPELLRSVFPDSDIAEKLIAVRTKFWEQIIDQETHRLERTKDEGKGRKKYKEELAAVFKSILIEAHLDHEKYTHVIDFSLGKYGNIIYITDPISQIVSREKFQKLK